MYWICIISTYLYAFTYYLCRCIRKILAISLSQVKIRSVSSIWTMSVLYKRFRIGTMVAAVPQLHESNQRRSRWSKQKHPVRTDHRQAFRWFTAHRWFTRWSIRWVEKTRQDIAFEDHKDPTEVSLTEVSLTPSKPQVFSPPVATVAVALPPKTETDTAKPPEHSRPKFEHSQRLKMESKQSETRVLSIIVIWSHLSGGLKVNHFYQRIILQDPLHAVEMLSGWVKTWMLTWQFLEI